MHLHNRRKPVIFSVLLLRLLLHKCVFACMCHCECVWVCVFERARAEPCINKAGHGFCTWPLIEDQQQNDRTFSFFHLSSFASRKKTKQSREQEFSIYVSCTQHDQRKHFRFCGFHLWSFKDLFRCCISDQCSFATSSEAPVQLGLHGNECTFKHHTVDAF